MRSNSAVDLNVILLWNGEAQAEFFKARSTGSRLRQRRFDGEECKMKNTDEVACTGNFEHNYLSFAGFSLLSGLLQLDMIIFRNAAHSSTALRLNNRLSPVVFNICHSLLSSVVRVQSFKFCAQQHVLKKINTKNTSMNAC